MRFNKWVVLAVVLAGLVLSVGLAVQASPPGQQPGPQGHVGAQGSLGTAFTYQGQLKSGGEPVDESCDMAFRLYDAESGGSQVSSAISTTVPVVDGLFTVDLDFGGVFTGDARWLALAVRCPAGSGAYEALAPRQPLSPTPYAMYAARATTATIASGVEMGVIAPTHLSGIAHNGIGGQVLASDGSGGFAWATPADVVVTGVVTTGLVTGLDPVPSYPFEFDISALGSIPPSSVTVVASGFKASSGGDPESPVMIDWEVTGTEALTLTLRVWDASGVEFKNTSPVPPDWSGKRLKLSFVATGQ